MRRGYFVAGLGGAQFAQPGAVDRLRAGRDADEVPSAAVLAATDPANPYGVIVPWPAWNTDGTADTDGTDRRRTSDEGHAPKSARQASRSAGARVVLVDGDAVAWIARGNRQLLVALPRDEPERSAHGRALADALVSLAEHAVDHARGWLIEDINAAPAVNDPVARYLNERGFVAVARGALQLRVAKLPASQPTSGEPVDDEVEALDPT